MYYYTIFGCNYCKAKKHATMRKQDIIAQIKHMGYPVKYYWSLQFLKEYHQKKIQFVRKCDTAYIGSVWEIILTTKEFWKTFSDIRILCLLAQTSSVFSRSVPFNDLALQVIASQMPFMSHNVLTEIFRIPHYVLNGNVAANKIWFTPLPPRMALDICFQTHGNALGLFRKRQTIRTNREKNGKSNKSIWPMSLTLQRLAPFLFEFVLLKIRNALCPCTISITNAELTDFIRSNSNKLGNIKVCKSVVYSLMIWINNGRNIITKQWHQRALLWNVNVGKLFDTFYPYTARRLLKSSNVTLF